MNSDSFAHVDPRPPDDEEFASLLADCSPPGPNARDDDRDEPDAVGRARGALRRAFLALGAEQTTVAERGAVAKTLLDVVPELAQFARTHGAEWKTAVGGLEASGGFGRHADRICAAVAARVTEDKATAKAARRADLVATQAAATEHAATGSSLPTVNVGEEQQQLLTMQQVRDILTEANDPPTVFTHGEDIVSLADGRRGPRFIVHDETRMLNYLRSVFRPVKYRKPKSNAEAERQISDEIRLIEVDARMPDWIAKDVLRSYPPPFPPLDSIATAPTLAPPGRLILEPGYDARARLWYAPPAGFQLRPVSPNPTAAEVEAAKGLLFETWLGEFKFAGPRDKAHAVALLFAPFVRPMIAGPTPMHLVEASTPGTGKTLLPELLATVFLGRSPGLMSLPEREEEIAKQIGTDLREGPPFILFDNVKGRVKSAALESALTGDDYRGRVLGVMENVHAEIRTTWIMTANNPQLGEEMARRCVRIRLDADRTKQQGAAGYTIPEIKTWTKDHRAELVHAVLTLLSSWLEAGMPPTTAKGFESFESWTGVMASLLGHLGIQGLLTTADDDDDEGFELGEGEAFCEAWFKQYEDKEDNEVKPGDLVPVLLAGHHLEQAVPGDGSSRALSTKLGQWLAAARGRKFGPYRVLRASARKGHGSYKLVKE